MQISLALLCPKMFNVEDARPVADNIDGREVIVPVQKIWRYFICLSVFL